MKRCHKCLSKITPNNPADTVNKWGKEECNNCAECTHGVKLSANCVQCEIEVMEMLKLQGVM